MIFAHSSRGRAEKAAQLEAAREQARQRKEAVEQRDRRRRAMAQARGIAKSRGHGAGAGAGAGARPGGVDGRRKLGRESEVLLDRVKRMVGA